MKTIVITGASGSGKSYLSNKLSKELCNSIVIKTDSYYRDSILIRFLSIFICDIYDRPLSIKKKELMKTLRSINKKESLITFFKYDFKRKRSSKSKLKINYKDDYQFLILEGVFAHRLGLNILLMGIRFLLYGECLFTLTYKVALLHLRKQKCKLNFISKLAQFKPK